MTAPSEDLVFQAGETLFDTEEPLSTAFFILEGRVALHLTLDQKTIDLEIGPNQFVGDAAVAVGRKPDGNMPEYKARAVALERVTAAAIPIADIQEELAACPPLLRAWFASFISRVLTIVEKLARQ
ncbi:MAG: Crp/Fnr family transcriptional regulator [Acidobacteriota bacterium]|nr:Crp/Fnr family transcriptional regulator [Acidobacteriota bacterium]